MSDNNWIQTYSGKAVYPLAMQTEDIDIEDVAHALSLTCRFAGHCQCFYSVAQHSVLVCRSVSREYALWGLLHDGSEAYLCDLPRPVKHALRDQPGGSWYDRAEDQIMQCIATKFALPWPLPKEVHDADMQLFAAEARDLMSPLHPKWKTSLTTNHPTIEPWTSEIAKKAFLETFHALTKS